MMTDFVVNTDGEKRNIVAPTPRAPNPLRLQNLKNTRDTLARFIRAYDRLAEPTTKETDKFRSLVYALSTMANIMKIEAEQAALDRIEALEKQAAALAARGLHASPLDAPPTQFQGVDSDDEQEGLSPEQEDIYNDYGGQTEGEL